MSSTSTSPFFNMAKEEIISFLHLVQTKIDVFFENLHRGDPLMLGVGFGALFAAVICVTFIMGENNNNTSSSNSNNKNKNSTTSAEQHDRNSSTHHTGTPKPNNNTSNKQTNENTTTATDSSMNNNSNTPVKSNHSPITTTTTTTPPPPSTTTNPSSPTTSTGNRTIGSIHRGSLRKRNMFFSSSYSFELFVPENDPNSCQLVFMKHSSNSNSSPVGQSGSRTLYLGRSSKVVDGKGNSFTVYQLGGVRESPRVTVTAPSAQEKQEWITQIENVVKTLS
jgi:hypothetical protein